MNEKIVKWAGLLGSILLGGSLIFKGQVEMGMGVITSALSSASVLSK